MGDVEMASLQVVVYGYVQGVFFRAFVSRRAKELGLTGYVRNVLGGEAVEDPYMTECCGSYLTVKDKHLVADRANKIVGSMARKDIDIIMVSCPLCMFNLDRRQKEARELNPSLPVVPVVYFTQLMALAMGIDQKKLGFEEHFINPATVLKKRKLLGAAKKVPVKAK